MSNTAMRVIRTTMDGSSRKIGEGSSDIVKSEQGGRLVQEFFPDVSCETAIDGTQYVPLREMEQIVQTCQQREQKAKESGFISGKEAGLQVGKVQTKKVFDSFNSAINDAVTQRDNLLRTAEAQALDLILKIARKVTCDSAKIDVDVTATIIKGAIDELADKREIVVKVNADHQKELESRIDEFKELSTDIRKLRIESDSRIAFGGCFIHTPSGDIDARLESQLDVLVEGISPGVN